MCQICKTVSGLHFNYLREKGLFRDIPNFLIDLTRESTYLAVMEGAIDDAVNVAKMYQTQSTLTITDKQLSHYIRIKEADAFRFAAEDLNVQNSTQAIEISKNFDDMRAAFTLIQSKAILINNPEIQKIAEEALKSIANVKREVDAKADLDALIEKIESNRANRKTN